MPVWLVFIVSLSAVVLGSFKLGQWWESAVWMFTKEGKRRLDADGKPVRRPK